MVDAEADLHQADRIGQSPLFIAADVGHVQVVRHLPLGLIRFRDIRFMQGLGLRVGLRFRVSVSGFRGFGI